MEPRRLIIALVLLAALGGAYYWNLKDKKAQEGKPKPDAAPKVVSIPAGQVQKIEWKRPNREPVAVTMNAQTHQWEVSEPKTYPADQGAVEAVLGTISSVDSEQLIDEKGSDLASYGLQPPGAEMIVTQKDGKNVTLLGGDTSPTGGGSYLKLANDPRVFLVVSNVRAALDKSLGDLRDRRLLRVELDKLSRLQLKSKDSTIEFGKNGQGDWTILQPKPQRADGAKVDDLFAKLNSARFDPAVSDEDQKKAATAFGTAAPVVTAKLTTAGGEQTLEIRKKDDKYYAKSSVAEGVWSIEPSLASGLDANVATYQNLKLFDFGFDSPDSVEVRTESKTVTIQHAGDKWTSGGKNMDAIGVMSLIDKIRDLAATKIVDTPMPAAAPIQISVTSKSGKRNEKVKLAKQGAGYLAQREGEASTYELDAKAVNDLTQAAADIKPEQKK